MKFKSNLPYLIICVIVVISCIFIYSYSVKNYFRKQSYYIVEECSKYSAQAVNTTVNYALNNIQLAAVMEGKLITEEQMNEHHSVVDVRNKKTPFKEIHFYHKDDLCPLDFHNNHSYLDAIKGNAGFNLEFFKDGQNESILQFYAPVYKKESFAGVVTGDITISETIAPVLESNFFKHQMINILIDREYRVIYSNSDSIPIGIALPYYEHDDFVKTLIRMCELKDSKSFSFLKNGKTSIGSACAINNPDWYAIHIIPSGSFIAFLHVITDKTITLMIFIILTMSLYIAQLVIRNKNRLKFSEKSNLSLINDLTSSYEDVYSVNLNTGNLRIYHLNNETKKKYGATFSKYGYDQCFNIYKQNEVYEKDWELLDEISTLEKIKKIFTTKKAYSIKYRVFRNNKIRYFECQLVKPFADNPEFILAFKNIDERTKQLQYLISLSKIYNTMHLINLKENTCEELNSTIEVRKFVNQRTNATEQMHAVMTDCLTDEYKESVLAFSDLTTVAERMKNKQSISCKFVSKYSGNVQAIFIAIDSDSEGKPINIVFATQLLEPNEL